ncbi:hypothetical protein EMIHUDRAFT_231148 [Emiliania huxleyi CCMP1516]|uniref:Uncharacterized protein n=2 Tax=Emiliania huxleyi TaxID=2903 RepID=A0A0D3K833_EMIH1|nr:hypothetical protein EMIHUDRAFT_231148 [Emiliania huxleyi CCMP1516]EOD31918.1 hypothetical protein EMIHUDRAFT_231148 [Emiliania huxleyi CCMP1516]|eukprot:XP_005784347.1 hypothetical protein EMIHUDRAFT_231148 [Emiliania huxleyi CCMP1516]
MPIIRPAGGGYGDFQKVASGTNEHWRWEYRVGRGRLHGAELARPIRKALEPLSGIKALRDTKTIHTAQQLAQVLLRFCSNTTLTFFLRTMPPSVTQDAAREHDRLMEEALYTLVGGARVGRNSPRWRVAVQQARLPVRMGGMGLTSAMDIREAAWVAQRFDELREAHKRLRALRDEVGKTWREWDGRTLYQDVVGPFQETKAVRRRRYHPPKLTPAAELLPLPEFSSTSEFLQQAQRRYTVGVHHRNWLALAEAFVSEASRRGGRYKTGRCKNHKCWREAIRFVAVSQEGAGAFLNAIPMRDDMKMETWAMRITVQRRLGLPLDVACQAVEAGKKAPNGKPHEELGDAAMVNPRAKHATRHKYLLKRLVKTLRSAWGMLIEMEPTAHLSYSNPKQPDVAAANIGKGHVRLVGDLKLTSSLACKGGDRLGWKGAFVAFGNTERALLDLGDYRFAREKNCDLRLLDFETFGGFGDGVRKILRQAADQLSNKLSHAQHLDEVTWTTKNWHGLQMQRLSVVLHTAVAWQTVNELACGDSGIVHGAKCIAVLNGVA